MKLSCFVIVHLLYNNLNLRAIATVVTDKKYEVALLIGPHYPRCRLFREKPDIEKLIARTRKKDLFFDTKIKIQEFIELCQAGKRGSAQRMGFIYPGTKWCGEDNTGLNYNDLGAYAKEDKCCREHDYCAVQLHPDECIENICNNYEDIRMHCGCDLVLRGCLRKVNTDAAITLSVLFFNNPENLCFHKACENNNCTWRFERLPTVLFRKVKHYHQANRLDACQAPRYYYPPRC